MYLTLFLFLDKNFIGSDLTYSMFLLRAYICMKSSCANVQQNKVVDAKAEKAHKPKRDSFVWLIKFNTSTKCEFRAANCSTKSGRLAFTR